MGGSSGSSTTSSTQPYIMSGPTVNAAQDAAGAQIQAAQIAANAVTQNTQSAISALMGQYQTSSIYANPTINTGNQAEAQMNYMLGLPAVNPGPAPTAPTAPNLLSVDYTTGGVTGTGAGANQYQNLEDTANWFGTNSQQGMSGPSVLGGYTNGVSQPGPFGTGPMPMSADQAHNITEVANDLSGLNSSQLTPQEAGFLNQFAAAGGSAGETGTDFVQNFVSNYNQPLQNQYDTQMQTYNQQQNQYNQQEGVYNKYNAMGQATPATINSIVSNLPGFQFSQNQGINAIQNAASASGQLNSGNLLEQLNQFGQGLSDSYYQNYINNLAGEAGMGTQALTGQMAASNNLGSNIASAYTNQGDAQANSALAVGNALAGSYLTPVANQQVSMTPYTTTSTTKSSSSGGLMGGLSQGLGLLSSIPGFSSKTLKEGMKSIDTQEILDNVASLNIEKWKYKGIDAEHIGPYAEEFRDLFGVGDGLTINMIDLFGVLIGSVKALSVKITDLEKRRDV